MYSVMYGCCTQRNYSLHNVATNHTRERNRWVYALWVAIHDIGTNRLRELQHDWFATGCTDCVCHSTSGLVPARKILQGVSIHQLLCECEHGSRRIRDNRSLRGIYGIRTVSVMICAH